MTVKNITLLALLAFMAFSVSAFAGTARVLSLTPGVLAKQGAAETPLALKMDVPVNAAVKSDATGKAQLMFPDNSTVSIAPDTEIALAEFVDTPEKESIAVNLAQGMARVITGEVSRRNPGAFVVNTPHASIGIRGTVVAIGVKGDKTSIYLTETSGLGVSVRDVHSGKTLNLRTPGNIVTVSPQGMEERKPKPGEVGSMNTALRASPAAKSTQQSMVLQPASPAGAAAPAMKAAADNSQPEKQAARLAQKQLAAMNPPLAAVSPPAGKPSLPGGGSMQPVVAPGGGSMPPAAAKPAISTAEQFRALRGLDPATLGKDEITWNLRQGQALLPFSGTNPGTGQNSDAVVNFTFNINNLKYTKDGGLTGQPVSAGDMAFLFDKNGQDKGNNRLIRSDIAPAFKNYQPATFTRKDDNTFNYKTADGFFDIDVKIVSATEAACLVNINLPGTLIPAGNTAISDKNLVLAPPRENPRLPVIDKNQLAGTFAVNDTFWTTRDISSSPASHDISEITLNGKLDCTAGGEKINANLQGQVRYGNLPGYKNYDPVARPKVTMNVDETKTRDFTLNAANVNVNSNLEFNLGDSKDGNNTGPIKNAQGKFLSKDGGKLRYDIASGVLYNFGGGDIKGIETDFRRK